MFWQGVLAVRPWQVDHPKRCHWVCLGKDIKALSKWRLMVTRAKVVAEVMEKSGQIRHILEVHPVGISLLLRVDFTSFGTKWSKSDAMTRWKWVPSHCCSEFVHMFVSADRMAPSHLLCFVALPPTLCEGSRWGGHELIVFRLTGEEVELRSQGGLWWESGLHCGLLFPQSPGAQGAKLWTKPVYLEPGNSCFHRWNS